MVVFSVLPASEVAVEVAEEEGVDEVSLFEAEEVTLAMDSLVAAPGVWLSPCPQEARVRARKLAVKSKTDLVFTFLLLYDLIP